MLLLTTFFCMLTGVPCSLFAFDSNKSRTLLFLHGQGRGIFLGFLLQLYGYQLILLCSNFLFLCVCVFCSFQALVCTKVLLTPGLNSNTRCLF